MVKPQVQHEFLCALEAGDLERLRELAAAGADVNLPIGNPGGETPLIRAVGRGDTRLVRLLIELGADVNLAWKGPKSWTPLMFAHDKPDTIRELAAAGADLNARTTAHTIKSPHGGFRLLPGGETALHLAAATGNAEAARALIEAGAEVEAHADNGLGPLDYALQLGSVTPAAEALVEAGAELTPKRLELMHSSAHRPDSDVIEFPVLPPPGTAPPVMETGAAPGAAAAQTPPRAAVPVPPPTGFRCPNCHALIYSRKPKMCGRCGAPLPPDLLLSDEQAYVLEEDRKWARDLADKFSSPGAAPTRPVSLPAQEPATGPAPALSPQALLRPLCFAGEFKHRDRPDFWLYLVGYVLVFFLIAFFWTKVGVNSPTVWLIWLGLFAIIVLRTWLNASPMCPNCKQNIRTCTPEFCHLCGQPLKFGRCSDCGVDHSHTALFLPSTSSGTSGSIAYCPGCGAHLDTKVSRWRPRRGGFYI